MTNSTQPAGNTTTAHVVEVGPCDEPKHCPDDLHFHWACSCGAASLTEYETHELAEKGSRRHLAGANRAEELGQAVDGAQFLTVNDQGDITLAADRHELEVSLQKATRPTWVFKYSEIVMP